MSFKFKSLCIFAKFLLFFIVLRNFGKMSYAIISPKNMQGSRVANILMRCMIRCCDVIVSKSFGKVAFSLNVFTGYDKSI